MSGPKHSDPETERILRDIDQRLAKLEANPLGRAKLIEDVALTDATETTVAHNLGKRPRLVLIGAARDAAAAGYVNEVSRSATNVVLQADDFGATITVDLVVIP